MPRPRHPLPNRSEFEAQWYDPSVTVAAIAARYDVSESLITQWALRFSLGIRFRGGRRPRGDKPIIELSPHDNHCRPMNDGPDPGDPTPADIAARAAEIKAEHLRQKRSGLIS